MSDRPLSEKPDAVRKRAYRERKRLEAASARVPSADSPPLAMSVRPTGGTGGGIPGPPVVVNLDTPMPPVSVEGPPVSVPLVSTEVVQGPGADAFTGPTLLDLGAEVGDTSEDGYTDAKPDASASPRLVDPKQESAEKPQTTAEEAAVLAKLVGLYVGFGWGLLAARHEDKLGPLAEQVADMVVRAKPELHELLSKMDSRAKFQLGLGALVGVVEDAAAKMCVERNIRIPWQNELIVAGGVGTATLGIAQEFGLLGPKKQKPQQFEPQPAPPTTPPKPRASPSWATKAETKPAITDAEIVEDKPAVRAPVDSNW